LLSGFVPLGEAFWLQIGARPLLLVSAMWSRRSGLIGDESRRPRAPGSAPSKSAFAGSALLRKIATALVTSSQYLADYGRMDIGGDCAAPASIRHFLDAETRR
jgi:hypothetical protein